MGKPSLVRGGLSKKDSERFDAVQKKASKMGVRDINFCGATKDSLEGYERTLEIIEKNKARYDRNANEA